MRSNSNDAKPFLVAPPHYVQMLKKSGVLYSGGTFERRVPTCLASVEQHLKNLQAGPVAAAATVALSVTQMVEGGKRLQEEAFWARTYPGHESDNCADSVMEDFERKVKRVFHLYRNHRPVHSAPLLSQLLHKHLLAMPA